MNTSPLQLLRDPLLGHVCRKGRLSDNIYAREVILKIKPCINSSDQHGIEQVRSGSNSIIGTI